MLRYNAAFAHLNGSSQSQADKSNCLARCGACLALRYLQTRDIIVSCSQLTQIQTPLAGEAAAAVLGAAMSRFHLPPGGE